MITVREVNNIEELAGFRSQWNSLLSQTPAASFFHSLDWLEAYWAHFGGGQQLRVLVVESDGRTSGILPLVVRRRRRRIGTLRALTYPLDDWASFYGPIGPNPAATLLAGLGHIRRSRRDWDLIELPWVDALGSDQGRTPLAMHGAGLGAFRERLAPSAFVDLGAFGNWDAYWASRTSHWRNNVRRSEKKLAKRGRLTYIRYRPAGSANGDGDPRWDWYEACEQIARASWQGDSATGTTLSHESIRPFLRDCHQRAAAAGALDLNLLVLDGRGVAFNYAYHYGGYVFGLRTGFDADSGRDGAGTLLQARMIEDSFVRGDHTYDLGQSYLECKRYWQTHARCSYRYTHFAPGAPLAQLTRAKRRVERWIGGRLAVAGDA
jgi:CelD/BcsL family acetyltransferase involved in cellulose biosynthesis